MKTILIFSLVLMILNSSCYTTKITHTDVINEITGSTKDEIISVLGLPSYKQTEGEYEQWVYDMGQSTVSVPLTSSSNTNVTVNPFGNSANINTRNYGGGNVSRTYNKYIKIVFKNDIVISCDTAGVDLSVKEYSGKTTLIAIIFFTTLTYLLLKPAME